MKDTAGYTIMLEPMGLDHVELFAAPPGELYVTTSVWLDAKTARKLATKLKKWADSVNPRQGDDPIAPFSAYPLPALPALPRMHDHCNCPRNYNGPCT